MDWRTDCPDWERRIVERQSLLPHPPLFPQEAESALSMFHALKLVDVYGMPTLGETSRPWINDFVASIFGAYDAEAGRRLITEFFMLISKKNSKDLDVTCPVATPDGFKTIAELRVGDQVIGDDGKPTLVVAKSEVFNHKCYEVEFSTGEKVVCGAGHLWVTDAHRERDQNYGNRSELKPRAKTTQEIAETLYVPSGEYVINNHRTSLPKAIDLPQRFDLLIAPYVLGYWLGNGHSKGGLITCHEDDAMYVAVNFFVAGQPVRPLSRKNKAKAVVFSLAAEEKEVPFLTLSRQEGVYANKHIPTKYLRSSFEQRLSLLQGLMDSDGTISKKGQASYSTTSPKLRDDVLELINSLGLKGSVNAFVAKIGGKDCGPAWNVQFWPFDTLPVFTLPRKLARQTPSKAKNALRSKTRQIVACREVPSVPTQCISVANKSHQFLITRSLIPTHNSTTGAGIMLTALLRNWRHSAEFLIVAPTVEVANNSFKPAQDMVREDDELRKLLHVQSHIRTITHKITGATLKVIAADSEAVGGKKATGILIDELWMFGKRANAENMLLEATGGMASRPEGFVIYLTTQSDEAPAGVFKQKLEYARDVRDGKIKDRTFLPVLYEFPRHMIEDKSYLKPEFFYVTNPNLGASVGVEFIENKFRQAANGEKGEDSYQGLLAKHLDVEIGLNLHANRWPGAEYWMLQAQPGITMDSLIERCEVITAGIDGGGLDDLLGLALAGREIGTSKWLAWTHAWVHPSALKLRKSEAPKFEDFRQDRDLTFVERIGTDVTEVADIISRVKASGKLDSVGVDPHGLGGILDALVAAGIPEDKIKGISQGWKMVGAIKTTERKLAEGTLIHGGQRMMNWCVGNAKVEQHGNAVSITKQSSGTAKIDPLMALFNAVTLLALNPKAAIQDPGIRWL